MDRQQIIEALIAGGGYATLVNSFGALDRQLAYVDHRESLRPLILALPDRERTILALRFFDGLTRSQIAARAGISQMQVSRLLAQTLAHFRCQLLKH